MSIARPSLVATALASVLVAPFALDALVPAAGALDRENVASATKPRARRARDAGTEASSGGAACALAGTWAGRVPAGPFAGQTNVWTLAAGGSYASAIGASSLSGTWSLDGTTLTVTDTGSNPTYLACPAGQRGTYRVDFAASCNGITLHALEEPCDGRRVALDGFAPTRR
ncbi:MAG: hypothetical protein U0230_26570 [Polyangiales bacterium]